MSDAMAPAQNQPVLEANDLHKRFREGRGADALDVSVLHVSFLPSSVYLISRMPSDPQQGDIVPIVVISLILAFVATLYPSWRASRLQPAEALRHE